MVSLRTTVALASGVGALQGGNATRGRDFGGLDETGVTARTSMAAGRGSPGSPGAAPPVVVYRGLGAVSEGGQRSVSISGLKPNGKYAIRLRRVGRAACSAPSPALVVTTPPMPPLAPAVCEAFP